MQRNLTMRRLLAAMAIVGFVATVAAQEAGPYKVLQRAKVGGEGGWDYIYADAARTPFIHPAPRIAGGAGAQHD